MSKNKQEPEEPIYPPKPEGWFTIEQLVEAGFRPPLKRQLTIEENVKNLKKGFPPSNEDDHPSPFWSVKDPVISFLRHMEDTLTKAVMFDPPTRWQDPLRPKMFDPIRDQAVGMIRAVRADYRDMEPSDEKRLAIKSRVSRFIEETLIRETDEGTAVSPLALQMMKAEIDKERQLVTREEVAEQIQERDLKIAAMQERARLREPEQRERRQEKALRRAERLRTEATSLEEQWQRPMPEPRDLSPEGKHIHEKKGPSID